MKKSSGIASSCRIFPWSKASSGSSTFLHRLSSRKVAPFSRRKRSVERATAAAAAAQRMWSRIALRAGWVTERARSRAYRVSSPRWRAVFSRGIFLVLVSRVLTSQLTVRYRSKVFSLIPSPSQLSRVPISNSSQKLFAIIDTTILDLIHVSNLYDRNREFSIR